MLVAAVDKTVANSTSPWLPNEVLGEIMTLTVPSLLWDSLDSIIPTHRKQLIFHHMAYSPIQPSIIQNNLRLVCLRWDGVIRATPRAWNTLVFDRRLPGKRVQLEHMFQRSKNCHLDIYIDAGLCFQDTTPDIRGLFTSPLKDNLPRIRALLVRNWESKNSFSYLRWPMFLTVGESAIQAPAMRYLSLLDCKMFHFSGGTAPKLHAPRLSRLSVIYSNMAFDYTPEVSASLRSIKLSVDGLSCIPVDFLLGCRSLEVLELVPTDITQLESDEGEERKHADIKDIPLPSLQVLHFFSYSSLSGDFLSRIKVPALRTLVITGGKRDSKGSCFQDLSPVIMSLLQQDLPKLSYVTFNTLVHFELRALQTIFSHLPLLTILVLEECLNLEPLFEALTLPMGEVQGVCPELRRVILRDNKFEFSDYLLFFNTRTRKDLAERRKVRRLSCVEVRDQCDVVITTMKASE